MASEKALYWMTVGLLTVVMGNHFINRFDGNCLADRSRAAVERITAKADHLVAMADVVAGGSSARFDRAQAAMAMARVHMASMQTGFARQEAACARLSATRARVMVQEQLSQMQVPLVHPRPRVEMAMPRPPAVPSADPI
jgi:hypothetical protein